MDLIPNISIEAYFDSPKRQTLLNKLEVHKCDSIHTLLYMFSRAPPIIYDHFYNTLELTKNDIHMLKFIVETIERKVLNVRYAALKNARILTKINEAIEERKEVKVYNTVPTKYNIGYRLQIGQRMQKKEGMLVRKMKELSQETGIGTFSIYNWYTKVDYYIKMGKKYPGILNMYKFGNLERKNTEEGRIILQKGMTEFCKLMDVTKSRTLILNLLFYIQAAALKFGEEVEIALSALKVKAYYSYTRPAVLYPKLEEFEQVYHKWLKQGGIPTINVSSGYNKNISNQNNHNNKEIMNFMEVPVLSVSDENLSPTSSKHTPNNIRKWDINLGDNEPKIYEEAEPKIPNIRQIRHRFAKGKFGRGREPKAQIGKTKYDIMEERWAIVILYKYLVITPAELAASSVYNTGRYGIHLSYMRIMVLEG